MATAPRSPALGVYLAASWALGPLAGPLLRWRLARGKEDAARLGERLGHAAVPRPAGRLIWLHGASVGEAMSMLPLIARLAGAASILVTTGTVTSARRIASLLPDGAVHQFVPVDTAGPVAQFLDHWRPDLAIWVESELWPRLVAETARRGTPMALVNARMSARSAAGWRRAPGMIRALLGCFARIETQDGETLDRLKALGADPARVSFGGNLKALVPDLPCDAAELERYRAAIGARPVWLAASTHPGEEEAVIAAHRQAAGKLPDLLTILAPRHPERADEVAALLDRAGLATVRRSGGGVPAESTAVLLADTLGEMGLWYRLAPVTFVGGTLGDRGGHTPFEPLALGSAILYGPDVANFAPAYAALDAAGGAQEVTAEVLGPSVAALLADTEHRAAMVAAAREAHRALAPDADALAARLLALIEPG